MFSGKTYSQELGGMVKLCSATSVTKGDLGKKRGYWLLLSRD